MFFYSVVIPLFIVYLRLPKEPPRELPADELPPLREPPPNEAPLRELPDDGLMLRELPNEDELLRELPDDGLTLRKLPNEDELLDEDELLRELPNEELERALGVNVADGSVRDVVADEMREPTTPLRSVDDDVLVDGRVTVVRVLLVREPKPLLSIVRDTTPLWREPTPLWREPNC